MKFFTSDLHFGHKNIVKFTERNRFTCAEEHTEWLISLWNTQVKPGDLVYHLGDFSFFKKYEDVHVVLNRLNGQKILLKGNHDSSDHLNQAKEDGLIVRWSHYEEIKIADTKVCLMHFPMASWNQQGRGSWHLHGHSHGNLREEHKQGKILDVGLDNAYDLLGDHKFFSELQIKSLLQDKVVYIADRHRTANSE